ncbi:hypothetical protein A2U01_0020553, partial [Trifolium medium]|nr:hypothetical protein [Trifolium medium]
KWINRANFPMAAELKIAQQKNGLKVIIIKIELSSYRHMAARCGDERGTTVARGEGETSMSDGRRKMEACFCVPGAWFVKKKEEKSLTL